LAHNHDHGHDHHNSKNIKIAFLINLVFTILEIIGGLWTNSMAILSDALHDLGDSISLGVSWFLENYSQKEANHKFTFGYSRFSLLGALFNSIVLIIGSIYILTEAIPRVLNPESIKPKGMLVFAIIGVLANGLAVLRLRKGDSLNEKVVSWHLLEDVLGWFAVLIVSIILIYKEIPVLDPLLSISITIYVLYNITKNLKEVLTVFLQGVPANINIDKIQNLIINKTSAKSVHHTHIWSMEGQKNLLSTHVIVDDKISKNEVVTLKNNIKNLLERQGIEHVTIEIDFENEKCEDRKCWVDE